MQKYESKYKLPYVHLNMSKDLSDSIRDFGLRNIRDIIKPLLIEKLKTNESK